MKKFLMLAIILLNLLPVISDSDYYQASAQTWSTEYDVCYMASTNTYYFWDKGDCNYYYHILHDVAGLNVDNCGDVESYIDKGCAVLGCGLFGATSPSAVEHMVTIVGYDYSNYYCIDPGYSKVQVYPKNNFNADYFYGYSK